MNTNLAGNYAMNRVTSTSQIVLNVLRLHECLHSSDRKVMKWAVGMIRRGNNFVAYRCAGAWLIAPSRFCGYVGNTHRRHRRERPSGSETDSAIRRILGMELPREDLEAVYRGFCEDYSITPYRRFDDGERRYWIVSLTGQTSTLAGTRRRSISPTMCTQ